MDAIAAAEPLIEKLSALDDGVMNLVKVPAPLIAVDPVTVAPANVKRMVSAAAVMLETTIIAQYVLPTMGAKDWDSKELTPGDAHVAKPADIVQPSPFVQTVSVAKLPLASSSGP